MRDHTADLVAIAEALGCDPEEWESTPIDHQLYDEFGVEWTYDVFAMVTLEATAGDLRLRWTLGSNEDAPRIALAMRAAVDAFDAAMGVEDV